MIEVKKEPDKKVDAATLRKDSAAWNFLLVALVSIKASGGNGAAARRAEIWEPSYDKDAISS